MRKAAKFRRLAGFTLLELIVVLAVLTVVMGGVFRLLRNMQVRNSAEQNRLDIVQPGREVLDQIAREIGQAGVPSARLFIDFDPNSPTANQIPSQAESKNYVAVGLTQITPTSLTFEGDVDGDGQVDVITYQIVSTGDGCPCLRRSQITKVLFLASGTPTTTTILTNLDSGAAPFVGLAPDNSQITNVTYSGNALQIASVKKVQITLPLRSTIPDLDTKRAPTATMQTAVNIRNCSPAYMNILAVGSTAPNACF